MRHRNNSDTTGWVAPVRKHGHLPPEEIIAELYPAALEFAGGTKQKDDLTAVVIKRTGTENRENDRG
jgi:serine phosphatase RsbU (regulator of sigma subunit)